jgi:hypothetical protein
MWENAIDHGSTPGARIHLIKINYGGLHKNELR